MQFILVLVLLQVLLFTSGILGQSAAKQRARPCNTPILKNGIVRVRSRGRFARFVCNPEFTLHGPSMTGCTNGRWEGEMPVCVAPGCAEIASPPNATLTYLKRGTGIKLTCNSRYELVGNAEAFCDGIEWDRPIGGCRQTNITSPLFCDFEGRLKCGWSNYLLNEKDWLHTNMGRYGIGPQHDHTKITKYEGFFMLLEGETPRYPIPSYLFSPMYDSAVSNNSCFKFYYHMYGVTPGTIRVFVKTAKQSDYNFFLALKKSALIEIANRSSNAWIEALVRLPKLGDNFQIVIQGELVRGQRTDLAIDDVEILDGEACEADKSSVTEKSESEVSGVFDVQSCQNRCGETTSVTSLPTKNILKCDCYDGCEDSETCCPDYEQFCIFGDTTVPVIYTTNKIVYTKPPKTTTPKTTIIVRRNTTITTSTSRRPTTTTTANPYTTKSYQIFTKRRPRTTTEGSDVLEIDATPHYMNDDYKSVELIPEQFDHKTEHFAKVTAEESGVGSWLIVTLTLLSIMVIGTVAGLIYRERTRVATPAEMKKKYHCKSANEEFSEIRFLTQDEQLDFTMATPMDD